MSFELDEKEKARISRSLYEEIWRCEEISKQYRHRRLLGIADSWANESTALWQILEKLQGIEGMEPWGSKKSELKEKT